MAKATSGQLLGDTPIGTAAFINDLMDVVTWYKAQVALGQIIGSEAGGRNPCTAKIRNLVGSDLDQGNVVQLGASLLTNVDIRKPWFEGNKVADPSDKKWAICLTAIKSEEIGEVQLSGACVARVNVTDTGHGYARPKSGSVVLESSSDVTPIEILSPLTATGENVFAVRLGGGGGVQASSDCHHLGTTDVLSLPVIAPDDSAYVLGVIDGCLCLFPVGDCRTS
jgi:hypothetical protein